MEIEPSAIDAKQGIEYLREPDRGYERVAKEDNAFLFILNPTRMEQIKACTAADEKMPQKSTDFYPKMVSGLTILDISADEHL